MDSAYIIQIQVDNSEEVIQVFARTQAELAIVVTRVMLKEGLIVAVQSLGHVDTVPEYLENNTDDLNFGCQGDK